MKGTTRALNEAHEAGAKFVLVSANIPMDTARFQDADAIVCAYLAAGMNVDSTAGSAGSENVKMQKSDGRWEFTDEVLYARGYSVSYD